MITLGFQFTSQVVVKNLPANAEDIRDWGSIPGFRRFPEGGYDSGSPLQYSFLENPMDSGACQAIVHKVTKSQIQLKQLSLHTHTHTHTHTHILPVAKYF